MCFQGITGILPDSAGVLHSLTRQMKACWHLAAPRPKQSQCQCKWGRPSLISIRDSRNLRHSQISRRVTFLKHRLKSMKKSPTQHQQVGKTLEKQSRDAFVNVKTNKVQQLVMFKNKKVRLDLKQNGTEFQLVAGRLKEKKSERQHILGQTWWRHCYGSFQEKQQAEFCSV